MGRIGIDAADIVHWVDIVELGGLVPLRYIGSGSSS